MLDYSDVVIIGAGISGISTALTLINENYEGKIVLVDAGNTYDQRFCHVDTNLMCKNCKPCNTFNGFGGSVHLGNSAKLSGFPSGKRLFNLLGKNGALKFQETALALFGKTNQDFNIPETNSFAINYKTYPILIITEEEIEKILLRWYNIVNEAKNIDILFNTNVIEINPNNSDFEVKIDNYFEKIISKNVVVGVGRQGIFWWRNEIRRLKLKYSQPTISKGLRFVVHNELLNKVSNLHPDFKTSIIYKNKKYKTFCLSAGEFGGRIKHANYAGEFMLVDGHGIYNKESFSKYSNFAILTQITENNKPKSFNWIQKNLINPYIKANKEHPGRPLIQKYIDFKERKISSIDFSQTEFNSRNYFCSDLSFLFSKDEHEGMCFVFEQLIAKFISGTNFKNNINEVLSNIYVIGMEIEGFWDVLEIDTKMQSSIENLFVVGDCAGVAHGILQASISGCVVANNIMNGNF